MKVEAILKHKGHRVITAPPDATIMTIAHRLTLERIGAIVISKDGKRVEGIVSERDIVRAIAGHGAEILGADRHVREIMTSPVRTCRLSDEVKNLMEQMTRFRIRHLPVVTDETMVGMISIGDVVKSRLGEVEMEADVLRDAYIAVR